MQQLVKHRQRTNKINNYIIFFYYHIFSVFGEHELLRDMYAVVVDDDEVGRREERFRFPINSLLNVASW